MVIPLKVLIGTCYVSILYLGAGLFFFLRGRRELTNKQLAGTLFLGVVFLYLGLALWTSRAIAPTGDEPFYLLAAKSIITDKDLDISNNYRQKDWKAFMPKTDKLNIWPSLRPDGRIYMDERVLFIAGMVVPYLIGGFAATALFMALLSSILIWLIYNYLLSVGFAQKKSFWVCLITAFSQPMITMNSRIYHNVSGAILILWAFLILNHKPRNSLNALIAGSSILALPWLHINYLAFCFPLAFMYLFSFWKNKKISGIFILLGILDIIIFLVYRLHIRLGHDLFGGNDYELTPFIWRSLLALFFDQEAGLFFLSPVYIFSFIGFFSAFFHDHAPKKQLLVIFLIFGFLILQGCLTAFGGGYDTGRTLIPILPFLALFLSRGLESNRFKLVATVLIAYSIIAGYLAAALPWLAINYEKASNTWLPTFLIPGREHYFSLLVILITLLFMGYFNGTPGTKVRGLLRGGWIWV